MPNGLRFCCAAVYLKLTSAMIAAELGGWGGVSSKRGLGGTSGGRPAPASRRLTPEDLGEGGPAARLEPRFPALILAPGRSPGKEGRAGTPERRRELNDWDSGRANPLARQPPGAS